ncbi:MAG: DUF255 domain-containing protein [Eubacteriales bacterium]|nr:DUF255 domain-containing protein [Eubacteriales bacterium]
MPAATQCTVFLKTAKYFLLLRQIEHRLNLNTEGKYESLISGKIAIPGCDEAFDKAKSEDKTIFLSVGYLTCHWCHVIPITY